MTPFYFDGNQWSGVVDSPQKWQELVNAYTGVNSLNAKQARAVILEASQGDDFGGLPRFGFRIECRGDLTLREWQASLPKDERVYDA